MSSRDDGSAAGRRSNTGYIGGLAIAVYVAAVAYLLYGVDRAETGALLLAVGLTIPGYLTAASSRHEALAFRLGLLLRIAAVLAFPLLSDDVYRFLWDGALWWEGIHPLSQTPEVLAGSSAGAAFAKTHATLLAEMNSRAYFTVYPPGSQVVFAAAGRLAAHVYWGAVALKACLLVGELALWRVLRGSGPTHPPGVGTKLYWLSPLAIVEVCGNGHFEGLAILGAVVAYRLLQAPPSYPRRPRPLLAALSLATGTLTKLVPLLLTPAFALALLWRRSGTNAPAARVWDWRGALGFTLVVLLAVGIGLGAFVATADVSGFGESLDLYFRNFEFNGSLYAAAGYLGRLYKGWNWIAVVGPAMGGLASCAILVTAGLRQWRGLRLAETLLWCMTAYLACATTVHPWYFLYLLALGSLTRYRWPFVLGGTAFLSYAAYGVDPVAVPTGALLLEYGPAVLVGAWEVGRSRQPRRRGEDDVLDEEEGPEAEVEAPDRVRVP